MKKISIIFLLLMSTVLHSVTYKLTHEDFEGGFFSLFHVVLGTLDFYERSHEAQGLVIDFEQYGFYYDSAYGPNWLNYYFDIPNIGRISDQEIRFTNQQKVKMALYASLKMARERGYELIQRYLPLQPLLQEKIELFVKRHFSGNYVMGIHYRGTDKSNEALSYDTMVNIIYYEISQCIQNGIPSDAIKIFIATDDQLFLNSMNEKFPGKILFIDAIRSSDRNPVHLPSEESNYKKGEDALFDCVLLSKCSKFYKSESNLSNAVIKFNPSMPVVELNPQITNYYLTVLAPYLN